MKGKRSSSRKLSQFEIERLIAENEELKAKNEEIKAKNEEMEQKLALKNRNKIFLYQLYNKLPEFNFIKVNKSETETSNKTTSPYTSNHPKILKTLSLNLNYDVDAWELNIEDLKEIDSTFFRNNNIYSSKRIEYDNELCIQRLVSNYIEDILAMMNLIGVLKCHEQTSISSKKGNSKKLKINYPDILIIKTSENRPICVVEIKKPHENILKDKHVIGQIYDYMAIIKNFYRQKELYGIITNLKEWTFLKLPESLDFDYNSRTVYQSKIYSLSDENLAKILIYIISESINSPCEFLGVFDKNRNYLEYDETSWRWKLISDANLKELRKNISFDIFKEEFSINYTIFKFLHNGSKSQTSLCITNNGTICVLKQYLEHDDEKIEHEALMWKEIYGLDIEVLTIYGRPTLKLPLILTVETSINRLTNNYEVWFQTNLKKIFTPIGAVGLELPANMISFQNALNDLMYLEKDKIRDLIVNAVEDFAYRGYIHNDLDLRHIGLLPVIKNGIIKELLPVLIDLEDVEPSDIDISKNEMIDKLEIMLENAVFLCHYL